MVEQFIKLHEVLNANYTSSVIINTSDIVEVYTIDPLRRRNEELSTIIFRGDMESIDVTESVDTIYDLIQGVKSSGAKFPAQSNATMTFNTGDVDGFPTILN